MDITIKEMKICILINTSGVIHAVNTRRYRACTETQEEDATFQSVTSISQHKHVSIDTMKVDIEQIFFYTKSP